MHLLIDPPLSDWPTPHARRPIWTGHQVSLFHPGIAAKYLAAAAVSARAGVPMMQVAVDQDVYDPLSLAVPVRDGDRLGVVKVSLGPVLAEVPVGMQPPVRSSAVAKALGDWPGGAVVVPDRQRVVAAFAEAEKEAETLGQQMDGVLLRLLNARLAGAYVPSVMASGLLAREDALLDTLLNDAAACARAYNQAVDASPSAGVARLSVEPDRIEVPVWALSWKGPRRRVYVDVADSQPIWITEDGEPITPAAGNSPASNGVTLAPRALLMTALLRRPARCSLFVHGTGGGGYDRITERWWGTWRQENLAPMAVVTADVNLDFDAPVNDTAALRRAVWKAHHLPHNLDRELGLDDSPAREKRELLKHMDDDRDKKRRRAAFELIHRINADLAAAYPQVLAAARHELSAARHGVENAKIARRRDWSFLLYPPTKLETLRGALAYPKVSTH
ncbi:MAG: hypothetical protein AAF333_02950 [Planctomycetota bacterium]